MGGGARGGGTTNMDAADMDAAGIGAAGNLLSLTLSSHGRRGIRCHTRQGSFETVGFANLLRMKLWDFQ
jgi:hypothetical protein